MSRSIVALLLTLVVLVASLLLLNEGPSQSLQSGGSDHEPLVLFCAAANRSVIESICRQYEEEFGRRVLLQFAPSQTLLSSIEVSGTGDLFLPADDDFIDTAREKALIAEVLPLATMKAVVAVRRGNPKSIRCLDDLLRKDVRFVQANPESAAVGRLVKKVLTFQNKWEALEDATVGYRHSVTDIASDLMVGSADAGIVYDVVLHGKTELEAVDLSELKEAVSHLSIGVVATTKQPPLALHFARYVAASDRGLVHFKQHGYQVDKGDAWSDTPELSFFAGSMLRPAIDDTLTAFEKREGVRISRVYNGCGILVAQMKSGQKPDAYFACDTEFMNQVPDLFPESLAISQNELVILVQKGNPHQISSLKDLAQEGLRVGIGHEKQCAMGLLTQTTLREGGIQQQVMENVTVQTPTGDMLVNQMQAGSLDAAVAYLSNAAGAGDTLDAVRIQGLKCSVATQPLAILPGSPNSHTAKRLVDSLCSKASQSSFLAEGFRWQMRESEVQSDGK